MRLLVSAASAAFIAAVALSAAAAPNDRPQSSPASSAQSASAPVDTITLTGTEGAATAAAAAAAAAGNAAQVTPAADFTWPLSPRPDVLTRFEQPQSQWSSGHRGVDLLAAVGQPVLSAGVGVVAFSGVIAGRGVITVRHSARLRTTYEPVGARLASGTVVRPGTRIGAVSPSPGHCMPLHCLHWGAISERTYRDPLSLLGFGRPILLPLS